ncbi:MAG: VCBS repeat domain-containing M23 family metallopeptidase [Deltaproteobacteria bacterium]|nr:VCBS repeat domain-containing M23 family metallopeptidase [Deltaproteobacteria bacterium]
MGVGNPIVAAQSGTVIGRFNDCNRYGSRGNSCGGFCGNHVRIRHSDGTVTSYCHMDRGTVTVNNGDYVRCGQVLGLSASSGSSTGPHLHFDWRRYWGAGRQEVFAGACGRGSSLWVQQRGYHEAPGTACGECSPGSSRACGTNEGVCEMGVQSCSGSGTWGSCEGGVRASDEECNGLDDDCDGSIDEMIEEQCAIEELVLQPVDARSDLDGDGRADVCALGADIECHLAAAHGFDDHVPGPRLPDDASDPSIFSTLRMGDLDGDGLDDICIRTRDGVRCWRSDGERGFDREVIGPDVSDDAGFREPARFTSIRLADVDGDGRADFCARWSDGLRCQRSNGVDFSDDGAFFLPELADDAGFASVFHYGSLRMGDLDGDGRADVCARDADGVLCWRSNGTSFGRTIVGPAWTDADGWQELDHWSTIQLADVDGDGRADVCGRTPTDFECHPFTGSGFGRPIVGPSMADEDGWSNPDHFATIRMADVNGDERADLCARASDGYRCWLSDGRTFGAVVDGPALTDAGGWTQPSWFRTIRLADVSGDGRADVCARDDVGLRCWRSDGRSFPIELPGPTWGAEWGAPERFATIRIGGMGSTPVNPGDGPATGADSGCHCGATGGASGAWPLLLVLLGLVRRRQERNG